MKSRILITILVLVSIVLAGCAPAAPAAGGESTGPVKIGVLAPLSGPVPTFGVSTKNGIQMAFEEWNAKGGILGGRKIEAIVEDSQCTPDPAVNAANKLIDTDKVQFIIGEVCSKATIPVTEITQEKGIVQISSTSTNPTVTLKADGSTKDYVFRACFIDPFQGTVMAKYVYETLGFKTAAVLYDNGNDYNKGLAENFKLSFEGLGGKIVSYEAFTDEEKTVDYKAQLTKIKAANPAFLYLPNYYGSAALQLKQAREMGFNAPAGGGDGWDSTKLVEIGGAAVEGGVFSNHFSKDDKTPAVQQFVTKYTTKYGEAPDALAALAYEATGLFLDAFKKAGSIKGSDIRDAMKNTTFVGISGAYKFDENRNPIKSAVVIKIAGGQQTYLTTVNP